MKSKRNHIDLATLTSVLMLMVLSLGVVYSASSTMAFEKWGSSSKLMMLHLVKVVIGFGAIIIFMNIDYRKYKKLTKPALIVAVVLLGVTLALGGELKGATRFLRIGGFSFQPSDFAKYALIFHICALLSIKKERIRDFKTGFLPVIIWIGIVTVLVLAQPNFSNGSMIMALSFIMLFVGRVKILHIALTVVALLPALIGYMLSAPYRMRRIMAYTGFGEETGSKVNYQLWQGIIGFGNGGIFGVGPGESKQRDFFLPESYGDFVFSIVGEEYGLIGTLLILILFLTIMLRGMKIARHAPDEFGRYLAVGITASITLYALINAGVTVGIFPTTGLPMPFVSYGGSSILFSSIAVGVLLNISSQTDLHPRFVLPGFGKKEPPPPEPAVGRVY
ncbi:MAG: FtsW/RodA/SpoVE family cell cycle protein [Bacteroidetes bacterium]|nr:FtsW/RodA/SpoVE family cell cycle protein [Bacteroidota bacterium]MCW5894614.1 FtsW/RodA/SpoVE family cell cycle protein [Bacteroidota bacterium]